MCFNDLKIGYQDSGPSNIHQAQGDIPPYADPFYAYIGQMVIMVYFCFKPLRSVQNP